MWSFILSIAMFITLVGGLGFWQRTTRRALREQVAATEHQIARAAEVAQRRHRQRYGSINPVLAKAVPSQPIPTHPVNGLAK
jgi:hypothetical protein